MPTSYPGREDEHDLGDGHSFAWYVDDDGAFGLIEHHPPARLRRPRRRGLPDHRAVARVQELPEPRLHPRRKVDPRLMDVTRFPHHPLLGRNLVRDPRSLDHTIEAETTRPKIAPIDH